jgi:hypothetical protein
MEPNHHVQYLRGYWMGQFDRHRPRTGQQWAMANMMRTSPDIFPQRTPSDTDDEMWAILMADTYAIMNSRASRELRRVLKRL